HVPFAKRKKSSPAATLWSMPARSMPALVPGAPERRAAGADETADAGGAAGDADEGAGEEPHAQRDRRSADGAMRRSERFMLGAPFCPRSARGARRQGGALENAAVAANRIDARLVPRLSRPRGRLPLQLRSRSASIFSSWATRASAALR